MCLLDVVFNFFLIYETRPMTLFGTDITMPGAGMGVPGAALGTALAYVVTGVMLIWFATVKSPELSLRHEKWTFAPLWNYLRNAAKVSLLGGGGVDGTIHRAAGPELLAECRTLGGCKTGQAKITKGYRLPAKFVIHTVGPVWRGGSHGERELLVSAYRSSLELALAYQCETVAFPLISSGVYGYPKDQALKVAVDTIGDFLLAHDMTVYLVIFDRTAYTIGGKLFADIAAYIDDRYVDAHTDSREIQRRRMAMASMPVEESECMPAPCATVPFGLDEALSKLDESFSQMLLRKIDEAGLTDAQCYKKANIDRKLFSKIRSDIHYKPSKPTAMAFAIALELPLEEAREMLEKAGFAFSHASKFDIIVEYFIAHRNYNIFEINEALFAFDQSLLGG